MENAIATHRHPLLLIAVEGDLRDIHGALGLHRQEATCRTAALHEVRRHLTATLWHCHLKLSVEVECLGPNPASWWSCTS